MADRGRGGLQQPKRPAPVSNPQSGARTDGGAGSKGQPLRVPTGGKYGEAKGLTEQQQAAPLAAGGPGVPAQGGPPAGAPVPQAGGAFGPTQRPNEPNNVGGGEAYPDATTQNPQAALRVLYSKFPHPAISNLIDWTSGSEQR